jgi:hypothetical protein
MPTPSRHLRKCALAILVAAVSSFPGTAEEEAARPHPHYASEEAEEAAAELRLRGNPASLPHFLFLEAAEKFREGDMAGARKTLDSSLALGEPTAERLHLLGTLALSRKDSAAALAAFEQGWIMGGDERNFAALVPLKAARTALPPAFLRRNLDRYRGHPAAVTALYEACASRGHDTAQLAFCKDLTALAQRDWWPSSAEWKLRHARVLRALGRRAEMRPVLLEALDILDSRPDAASPAGTVPDERKEILALLAQAGRP